MRAELRDDQAVVGFCGGPFTVAGYLIEGKPSRDFVRVKSLMYGEPAVWHALMAKLADTFGAYVRAKVRAGADVIQVFDSWAGALSIDDYAEFVAPYSARILESVDVPTIHFGTGPRSARGDGRRRRGRDRARLACSARPRLGHRRGAGRPGQPRSGAAARAVGSDGGGHADVLERARGRPGHIFNLGHGVLPQTDPARRSTRLRELVHELTVEARRTSPSS